MPRNLCAVTDVLDLNKIEASGKNVLLYSWKPSDLLQKMIRDTRFADLPEGTTLVTRTAIPQLSSITTRELERRLFAEFEPVLSEFAKMSPSGSIKLELCKTHSQSCPLFHVDRLKLRLLCTLRGPGTEWLDDRAVRRKALGHGDNRKIVRQGAVIYEVEPFHVCLLKGDAYLGSSGLGAVHRSPAVPMACDGRWFLRIDVA